MNINTIKNIITNISGQVAATLLVPMVLVAVVQVVSRYVFNSPVTFTEELLRFLLIWSATFGAVYCFGTGRHLALGFLSESLPPVKRRILKILINLIVISFSTVVLILGGIRIVSGTMLQLSPTMQIPMAYVYMILPISGILITLILLLDIGMTLQEKIH